MNSDIVFSVSRERSDAYAPWREQARLYVVLYLGVLIAATSLRFLERRRRRALAEQEAAAQAAIRLGAARLEQALDGAQLGLWELLVDTRQLRVDARGARMLGRGDAEVTRSSQEWTEILHPADRQGNTIAFAEHLRAATPVYENEFRVRTPGGDLIWLFSRGKVTERAEGGEPVRVIGTFMDITARKANEAALADAVLLQKKSGEIARIGGWTLEVPNGNAHWTDEVYRIHDLDPGQAPDLSNALDFYTQDSKPIISAAVMRGMREGTPWDLELQIVSAKGTLKWVRAQGEAMYQDGEIVRLTGAFQDITASKLVTLELERLNAALSELSFKDALTGLGNRRMFDDMLTAEWGRHARQHTSLALLMIDIDHFKRFNDSHGHLEGDECLRRVARVSSTRFGERMRRSCGMEARSSRSSCRTHRWRVRRRWPKGFWMRWSRRPFPMGRPR
ncbi:PAS domain-containing protein [Acidovorax sp.]|uniref:sensor domain-containing diguanylate cyclase n=1 Tax=Acidovorax sp. TaxID=1872122 RepID=UPI00391F2D4F